MTTTLSLNTLGGTLPSSTREYEYALTVLGPAGVVDPLASAPISSRGDRPAAGDLGRDDARSPSGFDSYGKRRMIPSLSVGRFALPARAPSSMSAAASKIRFGRPFSSTSVVESTSCHGCASARSRSALSSRGSAGSRELDVEGDRRPACPSGCWSSSFRASSAGTANYWFSSLNVTSSTLPRSRRRAAPPDPRGARSGGRSSAAPGCRGSGSGGGSSRGREDRAQGDEEEELRAKAHLPRIHGLEDGCCVTPVQAEPSSCPPASALLHS